MRIKLLAGAAALAALAACAGGGHKYPSNVQANFLNSCEGNGGNTSNCGCLLSWFQKHVDFTTFQADEDQVNNGGVPDDLKKALKAC